MRRLVLVRDGVGGDIELLDPTLNDLVESISALDGQVRTLVSLYEANGLGHMAIGGSAVSGLVVYVTFDNMVFWQLTRPGEPEVGPHVEVVAGGQAGWYTARHVVDREAAVTAASFYYSVGQLEPGARWDRE